MVETAFDSHTLFKHKMAFPSNQIRIHANIHKTKINIYLFDRYC